MLQSCGIYRHLTVREAVEHWASLYPAPARRRRDDRGRRARRSRPSKRTRTLSGGQQRRLDFALALIGDPELIFLDEPTTGFDPEARRNAWDTVRSLRDLGKTVLLTTHYLDEAQALADRVAIIKDGAILAEGAPGELGAGAARYRVVVARRRPAARARDRGPDARCCTRRPARRSPAASALEELSVTRPSLEDVYLELTAPRRSEARE